MLLAEIPMRCWQKFDPTTRSGAFPGRVGFHKIKESTAVQLRKPLAKWGISAVQRCKWCRVANVFLPGPGGGRAKFRWSARREFRPWNFGLGKAGLVIGIQGATALVDGGTPRKLLKKSPDIGLASDLCESTGITLI